MVDPANGGSGGLPGIFSVNFTGGSFNVSTTVSFAIGQFPNFTAAYNDTIDIYQPLAYDPVTVMLDVGPQQPLLDATISLAIRPVIAAAATNESSAHVMFLNVFDDQVDADNSTETLVSVEATPARANANTDPTVTDTLLTYDFLPQNGSFIAYSAVILLPFGTSVDANSTAGANTGRKMLYVPSQSGACEGSPLTSPLPDSFDPAKYE